MQKKNQGTQKEWQQDLQDLDSVLRFMSSNGTVVGTVRHIALGMGREDEFVRQVLEELEGLGLVKSVGSNPPCYMLTRKGKRGGFLSAP